MLQELVALAEKLRPDLTVIGPELPLVSGLSDALRARNLAVVGRPRSRRSLKEASSSRKQFLARPFDPHSQTLWRIRDS